MDTIHRRLYLTTEKVLISIDNILMKCFSYLRFDIISFVISSINYKQIYNIRHLQLSNTIIGIVKMIKKMPIQQDNHIRLYSESIVKRWLQIIA
jgi:hypothetical protein